MVEGYYVRENSGERLKTPIGQLNINVTNVPEFQELIEQAKQEADQLHNTINRLSNFELKIDFGISEPTSLET